jgi:dephospho-CoA kinase
MSFPLKVGITGGIGAGKTVVADIFSTLGIPVLDTDALAKWIINHNGKVRKQIFTLFGPTAYALNGKYNSPYVAEKVFNNPALLEKLNAIVHPQVHIEAQKWQAKQHDAPYTIRESALMIQAGQAPLLDALIVVVAPIEIRIQRVMARNQKTREQVEARIASQMSDREMLQHASFVIDNSGEEPLIEQVMRVHESLIKQHLDKEN